MTVSCFLESLTPLEQDAIYNYLKRESGGAGGGEVEENWRREIPLPYQYTKQQASFTLSAADSRASAIFFRLGALPVYM